MSELVDQSCDPVLLSSFVVHKKRCRVAYHRGILTWGAEGSSHSCSSLTLRNVLGVQYVHNVDVTQCCGPVGASDQQVNEKSVLPGSIGLGHFSFTIHYVERGSHNKLRHRIVTFHHTDTRQVASWVKTLRNCIAGIKERPKHLLLFVNPYGGKRKGVKIYERQVKPLFDVAGIEATVIITEHINHARDYLLTCSLDTIDGITCIGGDGTFAEVFNGLLLRTAKDCDTDPNDPNADIPSPSLRVGIIPGGSTDTMAYCFHGTIQVQTAILHIILGDSTGLDICSVHSNAKLLRYYSSVISYGFLGDVMKDSEKFRWMGPKRYDYSGFKKFLSNKGYEGEVTIIADQTKAADGTKCYEHCARCQNEKLFKETKVDSIQSERQTEQKTFRGRYFMVSGANVSCACIQSPNGLSPNCHLGDGCVDVLLVKHTNMINNLKLLLTLSSKDKNVYELPFVEVLRAREFTFRAVPSTHNVTQASSSQHLPDTSVWNCDGELQMEVNIKTRVHCQAIKVFTRRMPEEKDEETPCCSVCR